MQFTVSLNVPLQPASFLTRKVCFPTLLSRLSSYYHPCKPHSLEFRSLLLFLFRKNIFIRRKKAFFFSSPETELKREEMLKQKCELSLLHPCRNLGRATYLRCLQSLHLSLNHPQIYLICWWRETPSGLSIGLPFLLLPCLWDLLLKSTQ